MPLPAKVRGFVSVLVAATVSCLPELAGAQDWVVTAAAGRLVHESLGGRVASLGTTMTVGYDGPASVYLAGGAPFDSSGIYWGAAGVGGRFLRPATISFGVDAAADLAAFADAGGAADGWGSAIEAMPVARVERGVGALELRSGFERYQQSFGGEDESRTVHMSDVRLTLAAGPLQAAGELRYARGAGDAFPFAGVTAEYAGPHVVVWASLGRWFRTVTSGSGWGVGLQLAAAPVGDLFASYARDGWDPLFRNEPRRSWNVGLSRRLGRARSVVELVDAPAIDGGNVSFSVAAGSAPGPIWIAGDFTGWTTVAMEEHASEWVVTLPVPSGVHRYAFRDGNGEWFVPPTVPSRVDDGFGGVSAVLVVP